MEKSNIQTGINLYKSGDKTRATQVFLEILKKNPRNENAWLWLAACVENPNHKKDCFHKILEINPNSEYAQKALAELELQAFSDTKSIPRSGNVLKCPSCGSVMGKPDHTGLVQCGYCGTAITYHPPIEKTEKKNVERYLELCKSALEVKNYEETLQYANKALEVDPENIDAWINKAIATFWLTTVAKNRYDEAMSYLKKAEIFSPSNDRINKTKKELTYQQALWQIYLGNEKIKEGEDESSWISGRYSDGLLELAGNQLHAHNIKTQFYIEAMSFFLAATSYVPDDIAILESVEGLVAKSQSIKWNDEVYKNLQVLQILRTKLEAEIHLPKIKNELQQVQQELAKLKKRNSLFDAFKLDALEDKEKKLRNTITKYESAIAHKL